MSGIIPPVFLRCISIDTYQISELKFYLKINLYSGNSTYGGASFIDANSIKVGMWFSNQVNGYAWKITNILSQNSTTVECEVEDVEGFNIAIDNTGIYNYIAIGIEGFVFELGDDGLPIFLPLQENIMPRTWEQELVSRFRARNTYKNYINVNQSHSFNIGNFVYLDPVDGIYKLAKSTTKDIVGVVTSINIPYTDHFTYRPFGIYHLKDNINPLLTGSKGQVYYIDTLGNVTTSPSTNSIKWVQITDEGDGLLFTSSSSSSENIELKLPKNLRRGFSADYNITTGDTFGIENFDNSLKIFSPTNVIVGKYESETGFVANLVINPSGYIGINTENPICELDVHGTTKATIFTGTHATFNGDLVVGGNAYKPFSQFWNIASDQRIKKDVSELTYEECVNSINSIRLKKFRYHEEYNRIFNSEDKTYVGVLADELMETHPKSVNVVPRQRIGSMEFDEFKTIDISQQLYELIGCVQFLLKENEKLKSIIENK